MNERVRRKEKQLKKLWTFSYMAGIAVLRFDELFIALSHSLTLTDSLAPACWVELARKLHKLNHFSLLSLLFFYFFFSLTMSSRDSTISMPLSLYHTIIPSLKLERKKNGHDWIKIESFQSSQRQYSLEGIDFATPESLWDEARDLNSSRTKEYEIFFFLLEKINL